MAKTKVKKKTEKESVPKLTLTRAQKLSVEGKGKNILVSAGAGTGKTRVLVERFLHLVSTQQASVTEILALTFTEKAANEMKSRVLLRLTELGMETERRQLESSYISTIHAFAARLLKEHPIEAGVDPGFRVLEAEESDFLKEQALDEVLESECAPGTGPFELLKIYTERSIRIGLIRIFNAAHHEGKSLAEFFEETIQSESNASLIEKQLQKMGEKKLLSEWQKFSKKTEWKWSDLESFRAWIKPFSYKGGKTNKADWKDLVRLCQAFAGAQMDELAKPWRERLEALALRFETVYEARKRAEGFLDFDDLQRFAIQLFTQDGPLAKKLLARYREKFRWIMVDEFQDTNPLQLRLVEILTSGDNLFLVGDYKQSIYGFRGAEPSVFLDKEKEYQEGDAGVRIPLIENFRTESTTLDFINGFFKNLWAEDDFTFEELMAKTEEGENAPVELITTPLKEDEGIDQARTREAEGIAQRIQELHEQGAAYGDIAILFQAMSSTHIYEYALKQAGIPYFVISGRGFYHQPEIRDFVSFLSFLENPLSDIPLAATLRSPFFQISDNTLFWLSRYAKADGDWIPLFEGVKQFETIQEITEDEKKKLRFFKSVGEALQSEKDRLRLTELLDRILEKTSYDLISLSDPQGVRKYANIKKLVNLAREYESHEPVTLGQFLRIIKRLETREVRESEAQVEAEKSGRVVRLLTIHRAKGLEFPVVFVADCARQSQSVESKTVVTESGCGYGLQVWNELTLKFEKPLSWTEIDRRGKQKESEEWKRLFYVAATRAKNRLILTGVDKAKATKKERYHDMSSWMDWITNMPEAILESVERKDAPKKKSARAGHLSLAEKKEFQTLFKDFKPQPLETLFKKKEDKEKAIQEADAILRRLETIERKPARSIDLPVSAYSAYQKDPGHYTRIYEIGYPDTLGDLKASEVVSDQDEVSAADFGTAMHLVLERIDFQNPQKTLEEDLPQAFRLFEAKQISEAQEILKKYIQSSLFQKLKRAKMIRRELPFVLNERHGAIHGVIDLLYQDRSGSWHVVDYKTAVGDVKKVQAAGYDLQIKIYVHAVSQLLGTKPASGSLYFLKNQFEHIIDFKSESFEGLGQEIKGFQDQILELSRRT